MIELYITQCELNLNVDFVEHKLTKTIVHYNNKYLLLNGLQHFNYYLWLVYEELHIGIYYVSFQ